MEQDIIYPSAIKDYRIGLPVRVKMAYCRIVEVADDATWGKINGTDMPSKVLVATPHGTVIKAGILHLSNLDKGGHGILFDLEDQAKGNGNYYGGYLDENQQPIPKEERKVKEE